MRPDFSDSDSVWNSFFELHSRRGEEGSALTDKKQRQALSLCRTGVGAGTYSRATESFSHQEQ